AVLHLFGMDFPAPDIVSHSSPDDSAEVYAPGSILTVPLRFDSGVRIKILEAWARGVPVVATPPAVAGLEVEEGREVLIAGDPQQFATAIARLHREPALAASLVEAGRRALRERHDPGVVGERMMGEYAAVLSSTARPVL